MLNIPKPQPGEYASYAVMYIDQIPENENVLQHLQYSAEALPDFIRAFPAEKLDAPFAPGEWTIKEILGHVMDQERAFCYRALRFARGDTTELATFDHDAFVAASGANTRPIEEMLSEYDAIRKASLSFFKSLDKAVLTRSGLVGGNRTSVRALAWLIAGHEQHHLNSIKHNYL